MREGVRAAARWPTAAPHCCFASWACLSRAALASASFPLTANGLSPRSDLIPLTAGKVLGRRHCETLRRYGVAVVAAIVRVHDDDCDDSYGCFVRKNIA